MLPKVLWNSVLATPAVVGAALILSSSAALAEVQPSTEAEALLNDIQISAVEGESSDSLLDIAAVPAATEAAPVEISPVAELETNVEVSEVTAPAVPAAAAPLEIAQAAPEPTAPATTETPSLDEIMEYSNEGTNSMSQVTSITQLSDVQPTDWAYQALQSLVERYGCIAGYPDGTYRGQRAMTRFEFAAGMNACLDRISELIAASTADLATREDLATLQRLQEEFAAELAALRGRVDGLEARVSELEANQFSTTTKLNGETIFAVGVPFDSDDETFSDPDGGDQTIAGYRVRLNFDTSFTGDDLLRARLQARDFLDFGSFGGNTSWQWGGGTDNVRLDDLLYTFPLGDAAQIIIGANSIGDSDFVASTVSPFDSSGQGSLTNGLGSPPQYSFIPGGTGIGAIFQLGDNFSIDVGYAADNAGDPTPGNGLFNGGYGFISQLTFLSDFVDIAAMYSNSYSRDGFGSAGGFNLGDYENASDADNAEVANIYGAQVNFKLGFVELGGGAMYMPVRILSGDQRGDYRVWSYHGTVAFPDLGGDGNLLGFVFGVPPRIAGMDSRLFGTLGLGAGDTRQDAAFLLEGFYRFRVSDNISITPGVVWISDPGNDNSVSDTFVGAIRTTFTF
ncbi:MAG: carbohydrate porin [Synechococcales cyanobacterium M58_A2018_015]|nr:carbohydrate porin [Synechococcales cyanobacterium M58_A2018_015]